MHLHRLWPPPRQMKGVEGEIYSSPGEYTTARIWQDGANRLRSTSSMCGLWCNCQTKKKQGGGGRGGEGEGVNLPAAASSRRTEATCEDSRAPATRTLTNTGKGHIAAAQTAAIKQRLADVFFFLHLYFHMFHYLEHLEFIYLGFCRITARKKE